MTHEPPAGQLARGLAAALGRGTGGEVTMRLHPAALGHVKIAVAVDGRKANVRFTTGNAQARGLLSTSLGSLREALESRGLVIDRLSVEEPRGADPGRTEPTASAARTHAPGLTPREAHEAQGQGWPTLTPDGGQDSGGWTGGRDGSGRGARSAFEGAGTTRPAGTAGPSDEPPGGAVVLIKDGVQDPMGRIMLRLDALA